MSEETFDLLVIGSGPAGQKGAIVAAKCGKRVLLIERSSLPGGAALHGGTISSKTLREAILYLTGFRQRSFYGQQYVAKDAIRVEDLKDRVTHVIEREVGVIHAQLRRNGVETVVGMAKFASPHELEITSKGQTRRVRGEHILVACGTRAARHPSIPFDGERILDTSELQRVATIPAELIVVGAGVIGLEYASMFAALGVRVTVIDQRDRILEFVDGEMIESLMFHMRKIGTVFRLGEKVVSVEREGPSRVLARLESGKVVRGEGLLYAVGRQSNADGIAVDVAGLEIDARGRLAVDAYFRTAVPHIYAAGDVIGFPALAATSMDQGRLAVSHMFGIEPLVPQRNLPYGIYTIPEVSMVGRTEAELTRDKVPYEFGVARYEELARGQILGDQIGCLKILFHPETRELLGVHALGESATELVHIGQAVMTLGGTLDYFRDTVFNYPTLAEAYKVAALNGLNKLR